MPIWEELGFQWHDAGYWHHLRRSPSGDWDDLLTVGIPYMEGSCQVSFTETQVRMGRMGETLAETLSVTRAKQIGWNALCERRLHGLDDSKMVPVDPEFVPAPCRNNGADHWCRRCYEMLQRAGVLTPENDLPPPEMTKGTD